MSHPIVSNHAALGKRNYYCHKKTLSKYTLEEIFAEMCSIMNEKVEYIKGEIKNERSVKVRRMFAYATLIIDHWSSIKVGEFLCYKEHTTILYHRKKVQQFLDTDDYEFYKDWSKYTRKSKIWKEYNNK